MFFFRARFCFKFLIFIEPFKNSSSLNAQVPQPTNQFYTSLLQLIGLKGFSLTNYILL
jgi:hypothetical protein